jgi:DNA-binding transcriptional regulator YiaG
MASHTQRRKAFTPCRAPTPDEVKRAREWAQLTQAQAAEAVCSALRSWQQWEALEGTPDNRRMHPAFWRLFQKEVGLDPDRPLGPQLV